MPEFDAASASPLMRPAPDFDVRLFARTANGSHRDSLDLDAFADHRLDDATIRTLAYLHNIERATMSHLRSVLVTAMHKDARITAFMTTWAFEKFWIADALEAIVTAHEPEVRTLTEGDKHPSTIRESIVGNIIGVPMIGVHVTFCTVDEWVTQAAYRRIAELDPHPQLQATIDEFLRIKARHLEFLEAQSRYRLTESPRVRRLVRRRLKRAQWPIGAATEPREETAFFFGRLFATAPDVVTDLDEQVDTLPGQEGLGLIAKATNR
jgi:hypothetical protein